MHRGGVRGGSASPTENLNDFPPAGEVGGKMINVFLNEFPPAGEAGGKIINDFPPAGRPAQKPDVTTTTPPTTGLYLPSLL